MPFEHQKAPRKWAAYWRRSIYETEVVRRAPEERELSAKKPYPWREITEGCFDESRERLFRNKEGQEEETPVEALIAPIVARRKSAGGRRRNSVCTPLWIRVQCEKETGRFFAKPGGDVSPPPAWIRSAYLRPSPGVGNLTLGTRAQQEEHLRKEPAERFMNERDGLIRGKDVLTYGKTLLQAVNSEWREALWEQGFRFQRNQCFVLRAEEERPYSTNILKTYKDLLQRAEKVPPLFRRYADPTEAQPQERLSRSACAKRSHDHLAHLEEGYALSRSQREALCHALGLSPGEIMAIAGPPGTGKTTLVKDLVGSLWVKRALQGEPPPVVVATSTNNQAVDNVLEAFGKVGRDCRWLPALQVRGIGAYLTSREGRRQQGRQVIRGQGGGFPARVEKEAFLRKAEKAYMEQAERFFERPFDQVEEVTRRLQGEIERLARLKKSCIERALSVISYREKYGSLQEMRERLHRLQAQRGRSDGRREGGEELLQRWRRCQNRTLWKWLRRALSRFFGGEVREAPEDRRAFLERHGGQAREIGFNWAPEGGALAKQLRAFVEKQAARAGRAAEDVRTTNERFWELRRHLQAHRDQRERFTDEFDTGAAGGCLGEPEALHDWQGGGGMLGHMDKTACRRLFRLAVRYWEGRWIRATWRDLEEGILTKKKPGESRQDQRSCERTWRRRAMLTPCFATTMHSGPGYFDWFDKRVSRGRPHYGVIDWLIVDEAGQIAPEVAGPMFALARRAVVIGDQKQIQPVWRLTKSEDHQMLRRSGLVREAQTSNAEEPGEEDFRTVAESGLLVSEGSVQKAAMRSTHYFWNEPGRKERRGPFLAEHFRCREKIIAYCNALAYDGQIEPQREASEPAPFGLPPFTHVPVQGSRSDVLASGSRVNEREACEVAEWLEDRSREWSRKAKGERGDSRSSLGERVGVVTPFKAQGRLIEEKLRARGIVEIEKMKIGTVHALQGSERPLVVFSSVYGAEDDVSAYFFDRQPHILNVAVSRAKDAFVVIGDPGIWKPYGDEASNVLHSFLFP